MKSSSLLILLFFCSLISSAQQLTLLKQIGTEVNSNTGIGQTFYGVHMTNGDLYFQASQDGFYNEIWKTDGTTAGTQLVLTEQGNPGWSITEFTNEGIFINNYNDELFWYDVNSGQTIDLGYYKDLTILKSGKISEDEYLFYARENDTAQWWITDLTEAGTHLLGDIGEHSAFLEMFTSDYGATMYNTNAFITYEPLFYSTALDTIITVRDFLAPYREFDKIREVFLYENLMFIAVKENNFDKNYIFDLTTNEFHPTPYTAEMIAFVPYQDDLIMLTKRYLYIIDRTTFAIKTITDNVYVFSSYLLDGDRFYYIYQESSGVIPSIYYVDLINQTNHSLPESEIGSNHYDNRIVSYHGEIFYTKREHPSTFLRKFNPANGHTTVIDTIAVKNGSLTIYNALEIVNDVLVTSRYSQPKGHELYYLTGTSSTIFPSQLPRMKVYPNPAIDFIHLRADDTVGGHASIYDVSGKLVFAGAVVDKQVNIQSLQPGLYDGIYKVGDVVKSFRFIKN